MLDRVYKQQEAEIQDKVSDFFTLEIQQILSKEIVTSADIDMISFIFTKNHSIFNYILSSNGPMLIQHLANKRYPENHELAQ